MKTSVCVLFAVACWVASQAEESPMQLTLTKVMNDLKKINKGMDQSAILVHSPTTNNLKDCCIKAALECFKSQLMKLKVTGDKPVRSQQNISREVLKPVILNNLPSCNEVEGEKKCKSCESYSKVTSKMFVQNFQTLLQKIYASQS